MAKTTRDTVERIIHIDDAERDLYRSMLRVNRDDLDDCLVKQPELYSEVGERHVLTIAERDAAKLLLDELSAEVDEQLRKEAADAEEKVTETLLAKRLRIDPRIKKAEREFLRAKTAADQWQVLREAFRQRNDALPEVTKLYLSRFNARNSIAAQGTISDVVSNEVREERKRRFLKRKE